MTVKEKSPNVVKHSSLVSTHRRAARFRQRGHVLWLTGLSGAGKSTLAYALEQSLFDAGYYPFVLDGDNVRHGLCGDLAFSTSERKENIRRVSEVAGLFADAGMICIASFISPQASFRMQARAIVGEERFTEVYVKASVSLCEQRDPKGLYQRARAGEISGFTGVDAPYEEPSQPGLVVNTGEVSIEEGTRLLFQYLSDRQIITT